MKVPNIFHIRDIFGIQDNAKKKEKKKKKRTYLEETNNFINNFQKKSSMMTVAVSGIFFRMFFKKYKLYNIIKR